MNKQRGGTLLGFVLGLLVGLGVALAVAVYITKVPIPFMSKVQGSADKEAEAKKNRDWDPNAGLTGKPAAKPGEAPAIPAPAAPAAPVAPAGPQSGAAPDLLGDLAKARAEGKPVQAPAAPTAPATPAAAVSPAATAAGASADPFQYFVQAGAFRTPEDAEQQRAKLMLMGVQARVSERDQSGRTVYRVRLGPFDKKDEADKAKEKLDGGGVEAVLVRIQK
jgi:cell division protein FtsN